MHLIYFLFHRDTIEKLFFSVFFPFDLQKDVSSIIPLEIHTNDNSSH